MSAFYNGLLRTMKANYTIGYVIDPQLPFIMSLEVPVSEIYSGVVK